MKYLIIVFSLLTISCSTGERKFATYNVDIMRDLYKRNKIKGFVRTWAVDDKIYKIDSILVNENGDIKNVYRLTAFGGADTLVYDSLGRLIALVGRSDVEIPSKLTTSFRGKVTT